MAKKESSIPQNPWNRVKVRKGEIVGDEILTDKLAKNVFPSLGDVIRPNKHRAYKAKTKE